MTPLTAVDITAFSRLLDEAQDLSAPAREAWLAALPAGYAHLVDLLRENLPPDPASPGVREPGRGGIGEARLADCAHGHRS